MPKSDTRAKPRPPADSPQQLSDRAAKARAVRATNVADRAADDTISRLGQISDEKLCDLVRAAWAEVNRRDPVDAGATMADDERTDG